MTGLFLFLLATGALTAWWQLMQGRQRARTAAGRVCGNHDLQLLDDTVALSSVTWNRSGQGARIRVDYHFEFATNGARRRNGIATIGPRGKTTITLDLDEGHLIEHVNS
jgi:hypothetical protein